MFFSHVYNYCISDPSKAKATNSITTLGSSKSTLSRASGQDGANIVGGELYNKLKGYLQNYLDEICQVSQYIRE